VNDELDEISTLAIAGDADGLSHAYVRRAGDHLEAGRMIEAIDDLAAAARLHAQLGRPADAARCTQAAATALRAIGKIEAAVAAAEEAIQLAPPASPQFVSAQTELGEGQLMSGHPRAAIAAFEAALRCGTDLGLLPTVQAALHRRIAFAATMLPDPELAANASRRAAELFEAGGHASGAATARVEAATALVAAGLAATQALAEARVSAENAPHALADLELLETARSLAARDTEAALAHARAARQHALAANAVLQYTAAAFAIADLLDARGDRTGAYDSLAVGWVTAGDRIGDPHAAALFRPKLEQLRDHWGAVAFEQIKTAYYAARKTS